MTAVEWLHENNIIISEMLLSNKVSQSTLEQLSNSFLINLEQAKQMEKEQIMEAVSFGDCRGRVTTYLTEEEYYNEIYNK